MLHSITSGLKAMHTPFITTPHLTLLANSPIYTSCSHSPTEQTSVCSSPRAILTLVAGILSLLLEITSTMSTKTHSSSIHQQHYHQTLQQRLIAFFGPFCPELQIHTWTTMKRKPQNWNTLIVFLLLRRRRIWSLTCTLRGTFTFIPRTPHILLTGKPQVRV